MWPEAYYIGSRTSITVTRLLSSCSARSWALMHSGLVVLVLWRLGRFRERLAMVRKEGKGDGWAVIQLAVALLSG